MPAVSRQFRIPEEPTWRTKDGREIPLSNLEEPHLENIIAMLERQGVLLFEKYLLQRKKRRWAPREYTEDELVLQVEGSIMERTGMTKDIVGKYHQLLNERDRRRKLADPIRQQGPYGSVDDDEDDDASKA